MDDEEEKKYYGGELPTVNITAKQEPIKKMKTATQKTLEKTKKEAEEYAKNAAGQTFITDEIFKFNNATTKAEKEKKKNLKTNGDTFGSFSEKDTERVVKGSGRSVEQVAKEFADKQAYSPTGVWEFDLGYAAGRARKKKIDAAGGIEAFKAAKQEKKIARQKRKKDARAFDNQSARTTDKAKQRKKAAKLPSLMDKNKEVIGLPKNSNPYKPY